MDINQKLDDIIFRYGLDACYPNYRPCQKAQAIVRQIIAGWSPDERIACVVTDKDDKRFFEMSMTEDRNVDFYVCKRKPKLHGYGHYLLDASLHDLLENQYDRVYAISIDGLAWVESWLRAHDVAFISLYQLFEQQGLFLDFPYRDFLYGKFGGCLDGMGDEQHAANITTEMAHVRNRALAAKDNGTKCLELRKLFFLSIVARDFLLAEECINDLHTSDFHEYDAAWQDVQHLLEEIKESLATKAKETVFAFWIDATSYQGLSMLPRLTKIIKQGIHFDDMFSATPYTHPTARAVFCQKKNIDEEGYKIKHITLSNSPMLRMLEEKGYTFKILSEYLGNMFSGRYKTGMVTKAMGPSSYVIWNGIAEALRSEEKRFILMHCVQETHGEGIFPSPKMSDDDLGRLEDIWNARKLASIVYSTRNYFDKEIEYYESMLPKEAMKILFSDHGSLRTLDIRDQTFLGIVGEGIPSRAIDRMCSTLDFKNIFEMALDGDYSMDGIGHDYVELQDVPAYSGRLIADFIQNQSGPDQLYLGYRGVVTKEYFYLRFSVGVEYLEHRSKIVNFQNRVAGNPNNPDGANIFRSHVCDERLLPKFRKLAKVEDPDAFRVIKSKFSKYYLKIYENIWNRIDHISALMNQLVAESPAPIALRMGGLHTAFIIDELTDENKKKIGAILDPSPECLCSKYGYPVISPADFMAQRAGKEIKTVILSSFVHRDMLSAEAKSYRDVDVVEFYDWMAAHGVSTEVDLTGYTPAKEDFDVNFPFDEVE